jgi:hypothetical protein
MELVIIVVTIIKILYHEYNNFFFLICKGCCVFCVIFSFLYSGLQLVKPHNSTFDNSVVLL